MPTNARLWGCSVEKPKGSGGGRERSYPRELIIREEQKIIPSFNECFMNNY